MEPASEPPDQGMRRLWRIVLAVLLFGILMAVRHELSSVWARAAVAVVAFIVLGLVALSSRRVPS